MNKSLTQKEEKMTPARFWIMLIALGLGYWLVMLLRQSLAIVSAEVSADLGLDAAQLGILGAIVLYGYAAMQIPGGLLADWIGARKIISIAMLLTAVATFGFSRSTNLTQAVISRLLTGIGISVVYVPALNAIRNGCRDDQFPLMTSMIFFFGNFGTFCARKPMALLVEPLGWRAIYVIIAALALVVGIVVWFAVPNKITNDTPTPEKLDEVDKNGKKKSPWAILYQPQFVTMLLWMFIMTGTISGGESLWDMPYLTTVQNVAKNHAVTILTLATLFSMASGPIVGALANKRNGTMFAITAFLRAIVFLLLALIPVGFGTLPVATVFMLKGISMSSYALLFAQLRRTCPSKISGTLLGIANTVSFLGGAICTQGIGVIVKHMGNEGSHRAFQTVFFIFFAFLAVFTAMVCLTNFLPKKAKGPERVEELAK